MKTTLLPQTDNTKAKLVLEGSLQVKNSVELKKELLNLFENYSTIEIELKNIERIDITSLQLLVAFSNQIITEDKVLKYTFENTDFLNSFLSNSGFISFFNNHESL